MVCVVQADSKAVARPGYRRVKSHIGDAAGGFPIVERRLKIGHFGRQSEGFHRI